MLSLENKLKQYSNEQMGNIQVGGRNLMRFTQDMSGNWINRGNWLLLSENHNGLSIFRSISDWSGITQYVTLQVGYIYTLSLYVRKHGNLTFYLFGYDSRFNGTASVDVISSNSDIVNQGIDDVWYRVYITFKVTKGGFSYVRPEKSGAGYIDVCGYKLERGNTPTDWTPAPEDIESQISTAKTATEAYARTQSELTKAQAIAEANKQAGIAITAEQQARILQLQQNLQQTKTFAEQKVNELNIGGRNLILKSNNKITNNNYAIASFLLSEEPKENEQITFTLKGVLGAGKSGFRLYNKSGYQELCILQDKGNGIYQQTFNWKKDPTNPLLAVIYVFHQNVIVNSTIEWIKLEKEIGRAHV